MKTAREIPKLKLESINEAIKLNSYRGLLQEFQYGKISFILKNTDEDLGQG